MTSIGTCLLLPGVSGPRVLSSQTCPCSCRGEISIALYLVFTRHVHQLSGSLLTRDVLAAWPLGTWMSHR